MEGEEGQAENAEEVKGRVGFRTGGGHPVFALGHPWTVDGWRAKRIATVHNETVPVGNREA